MSTTSAGRARENHAIGPRRLHRAVVFVKHQILGRVQHATRAEDFLKIADQSWNSLRWRRNGIARLGHYSRAPRASVNERSAHA